MADSVAAPRFRRLTCTICGKPVTQRQDAVWCQPVGPGGRLEEPWARHMECREKTGRDASR